MIRKTPQICLCQYVTGLLLFMLSAPLLYAAEVLHSANEENGLKKWHFVEGDIEIELVQRLPDQTRAMLMKYAFSKEIVEQLALSCMFQTIIRNSGKSRTGKAVSVDLTRWRIRHDGNTSTLLQKEPLLASWSDEEADSAAKLVLRWGMFPTQQEFLPGDYNWGLTAYGIPPGSTFDLEVNWRVDGVMYGGRINDIVCAPDVDKLK